MPVHALVLRFHPPHSSSPPRQDDYGSELPSKRHANATGGVALGPAAAAVAASAMLGSAPLPRCDLCNATFSSRPELQQHLEGPAHQKALQRMAEAQQRRVRLGSYADAAEAAVAAASWARGLDDAVACPPPPREERQAAQLESHPHSRPQQRKQREEPRPLPPQRQPEQQQPPEQPSEQRRARLQERPPRPGRGALKPAAAHEVTSHEELLRRVRGEPEADLSIGGWVPPPVAAFEPLPLGVAGSSAPQQAPPPPHPSAEELEVAPPMAGLVAYDPDDEGESEPSSGSSEQGRVDAQGSRAEPAAGAQQAQAQAQAQQQAARGAENGSEDESSSESEGGGGQHDRVAFFTF